MNDVTIYPSSWYYNACVQGFLEVLAWGLGENGEQFIEDHILQEDGKAIIPGDLMETVFSTEAVPVPKGYEFRPVPDDVPQLKRIAWWWVEKGYKAGFIRKDDRGKVLNSHEKVETVIRSLFHKSANYPNLAQLVWDTERKITFLNEWFAFELGHDTFMNCCFCGCKSSCDESESVYNQFFTRSLSIQLGNGPSVFPNLFWDGKPNLLICKQCRSYFLCFHFIYRNNFFINSDSLQINWYMNSFLNRKLKQGQGWRQQTFINAINLDSQLRRAIGSWGLQNLEILIFQSGRIDYYPISIGIAKLLLIPRISSLIGKISNPFIWDIVLKERFDYLPIVIYKSLRVYLTGKTTENDKEIINYSNPNDIKAIVNIIDLCAEIRIQNEKQKGGGAMDYVNTREIRKLAADAPINLGENRGKNLVYRLLELTRMNKRNDVYHLLLRVYITRGNTFPETLARLFDTKDNELFKNGIYAYISGLRKIGEDENVN